MKGKRSVEKKGSLKTRSRSWKFRMKPRTLCTGIASFWIVAQTRSSPLRMWKTFMDRPLIFSNQYSKKAFTTARGLAKGMAEVLRGQATAQEAEAERVEPERA